MTININDFLKQFEKEYNFLHENRDRVAGYAEALEAGDAFISAHLDFVREFNAFRGDILISDREVAAFAFALSVYGAI